MITVRFAWSFYILQGIFLEGKFFLILWMITYQPTYSASSIFPTTAYLYKSQ